MTITFKRWKQKATRYINDHYSGELNHDLKMYLEQPDFRPVFDQSIGNINRGANEDEEIASFIRNLAREALTTALQMGEEQGIERSYEPAAAVHVSASDIPVSTTDIFQPTDLFKRGTGIHHHYYYW